MASKKKTPRPLAEAGEGPASANRTRKKVSVFGNRDQSPRRRSVAGARGSISPASPLAGRHSALSPDALRSCTAHGVLCTPHTRRASPAAEGLLLLPLQLKVGRRRETASFPLLLCGRRLFPLQIFNSPVACACLGYASARF